MAVLERSNRQKYIQSRTTFGMIIGLVIFISILITKASQLSSTTGNSKGRIGPFTLFTLSKKSVGSSNYLVDMRLSFLNISLLIMVCATFGFLSAIYHLKNNHKRDRIEL